MRYQYGDSTPSPLQSNFLAYLADAMEFCIHLLLAQERIEALHKERRAVDESMDSERTRITGLRVLVAEAIDAANTGGNDSISGRAVERVSAAAENAIKASLAELQAKRDDELNSLDGKQRAERDGCLDAFGKWIAHHEAHEGTWRLGAYLGDSGRYEGEIVGTAPFGVAWRCEIELAADHPMARGSRVGDFVTQIELTFPEVGGWLKKNTKVRPQRIDAYSIDEVATDGKRTTIALRAAPRGPAGLDVTLVDNSVEVTLGGAKETIDVEIGKDDREKLISLRDRLLDALTTHAGMRRRVVSATLDDAPLAEHDLGEVAKRFIDAAAPIVQEIHSHSLSDDELVIRRMIGDGRREELFVATSALLDKLGRAPRNTRALFGPLGLEWQRVRTPPPFAAIVIEQPVAVRPQPEPEVQAAPVPEPAPEPVPAPAPEPAPPPPAAGSPAEEDEEIVELAVKKVAPSSPPPPTSDRTRQRPLVAIEAQDKDALAGTVKRIVALARGGQLLDAYEAYAMLFEDAAFARQRPHDQRQVLKLMVLAKTRPPSGDEVTHAYRAALTRLEVLVAETNDPVDRELLAMVQVATAKM